MKKRIVSLVVTLSMLLVFLSAKVTFAAINDENIYSTAINEIIKNYGSFEEDNNHMLHGLIYGEFIDFDNNGTEEMLLIYDDKKERSLYKAIAVVYTIKDGQLVKVFEEGIYSYLGQTDIGYRINIKKTDDRTYLVVNSDDIIGEDVDIETVSVFSMSNGIAEQHEYYGEVLPWWDTYKFVYLKCTIDGNVVSEKEYKEKLNHLYENSRRLVILSNKSEFDGSSYYCTYDGLMKFIEQAKNAKLKNNSYEKMKNAYIKKLRVVANEEISNLESPAYYIYDINKDNIPELIIKRGTSEADYRFDVFSYVNDEILYVGQLPGGHISLCGVDERGILLYCTHMGYEMIFEGNMNNNQIAYKIIYEQDCSNKEYTYQKEIGKFRTGAEFLEVCRNISDYDLLNQYFDLMATEENLITVTLNGKKIIFDQQPIIVDDRTLVPLRAIFEELGATVDWDDATQTVISTKGQITISMSIGKAEMYKNGKLITLDVVPQLVGGRTLVPVRAVAEGFDCVVEWMGETQTVVITTINKEAVINTAKSLYKANEALGGVTNLASYAEVDTLLYNTMNDIDVAIGWNGFTLDMVSAGTTATIAAAKASMGDYSSVNSLGDGVEMLLSSSEIADTADGVLKDAVKQRITDKISSSVPDIDAFVLGLGRDAYDNNSKMILDLIEVHTKFKNNTYTYDDAVAYIVLYDTLTMNRKTLSMAVQVLSDELPENFLESLSMSAGAAIKSVLGSLFGDVFSGREMSISGELFTDIITAYTDYACGEGVDFFKYMKQINHPAISEWVDEVESYNSDLAKKLSIN